MLQRSLSGRLTTVNTGYPLTGITWLRAQVYKKGELYFKLNADLRWSAVFLRISVKRQVKLSMMQSCLLTLALLIAVLSRTAGENTTIITRLFMLSFLTVCPLIALKAGTTSLNVFASYKLSVNCKAGGNTKKGTLGIILQLLSLHWSFLKDLGRVVQSWVKITQG